jgi:hypothetical protein
MWDGGNIQKKKALVNHKSSEENSTAMSGEDKMSSN